MATFPDYAAAGAERLDTVLDWVRWSASRFNDAGLYFGHGTTSAWEEAWFLISWSLSQPWESFDQIKGARLTNPEKVALYEILRRRVNERIPAPYITGVAWFAGYPYKVTTDVLVPRSPIAELIQNDCAPWLAEPPKTVLDMCTGSGCIGIACAHQFSAATVTLADVSPAAVEVARQNIEFHQLDERVDARVSDCFSAFTADTQAQGLASDTPRFDLIVANPPYVDAGDFASMPKEYHAEPSLGLTSGQDGLDFTRRLLAETGAYLNDGGILIGEVGNSWPALEAAYETVSFTWPELENGGHGVFVLTKAQLDLLAGDLGR